MFMDVLLKYVSESIRIKFVLDCIYFYNFFHSIQLNIKKYLQEGTEYLIHDCILVLISILFVLQVLNFLEFIPSKMR